MATTISYLSFNYTYILPISLIYHTELANFSKLMFLKDLSMTILHAEKKYIASYQYWWRNM